MARTSLTGFLVAMLLMLLATVTAYAAPPANDSFAGRTVIPALPYQDVIDTTEATADPTDPVGCGGPNIPTVWYEFTPDTDMFASATTQGSDYSTGINVFTGDPTDPANLQFVNCGLPRVTFFAPAGETFYLMVTPEGPGIGGGTLVLTAEEAPPPVELGLQIDPRGSVASKTGVVTLRGTVTCSSPTFVGVETYIEQRKGRVFIQGGGFTGVFCEGETPFEITVTGFNGLFTAGDVQMSAFAYACDEFSCSFADAFGPVKLTGKK
jgi:hypothetical protein